MFVVFRADGGSHIGSGHIMRCLTLAHALRKNQKQVLFICRDYPDQLCDIIAQRGFAVLRLAAGSGESYGGWTQDAEETREALECSLSRKADWLVVDHYQLDWQWEGALRDLTDRILVIDDLCNRHHDCDLLLDQNLVPDMYDRYAGKVPETCRQLIGTKYALLQPDYARLHKDIVPRSGAVRRILIFFGGADRANLTERALDAFDALRRPDIYVDVVIGLSNVHGEKIRHKAKGRTNINIHYGLPSLSELMAKADFAIGAGGVTHWERLCLGLPSLIITLADNQRATSNELSRLGLVRLLGHHDEVDCQMVTGALKDLIEKGLIEEWSQNCLAMVDGCGADRVRAAMNTTSI